MDTGKSNLELSLRGKNSSKFPKQLAFTTAGSFTNLPESFQGLHSVSELEQAKLQQDELITLKRANLSNDEISLYYESKGMQKSKPTKTEPGILHKKLAYIYSKLEEFQSENDMPSIAKRPEGTILKYCQQILPLNEPETPTTSYSPKDPFICVQEFANKIDKLSKTKKRKRKNGVVVTTDKKKGMVETPSVLDPAVLHVAVPVSVRDIEENRLTLKEIREIPRFEAYDPGLPSPVLFLKNLHPKTDVRELVALFGRFDSRNTTVQYRLLNGRMKGQAFLTFPDERIAQLAMDLLNGYKLRKRPILIEFGKNKS